MSPNRSEPPGPGPLQPYELPAVGRQTLDNGLTVVSARHSKTAMVSVRVVADAGTIRESAQRAGIAWLTAQSLDAGASGRSGEGLAWEFERLGVELQTECSTDVSWLGATVATERLGPALGLIADVVRAPDFPAAEVERVRSEQLAEILQRRAEPRALANDLVLRFLYGDEVAFGRPNIGVRERVRSLSRDDAAAFHRAHVSPSRTAVVLVGGIDAADARAHVDAHFGTWTDAGSERAEADTSPVPLEPAVHIVDRPGSVQSEIRVAHDGVERRHPDYIPLRVMNTILGGAFTSRLNLNLRERHGYTYGVRSGFAYRRAGGPFIIQTAVATDVTHRAVEQIVGEVRLMHDSGATNGEVADARDYLAGVLPLELQTTEQVCAMIAEIVIHDLPDDYFAGYRAAIRAVTADDVAAVARRHLHPDRFTVCVVGDAASIRDPLTGLGLGPVNVHAVHG